MRAIPKFHEIPRWVAEYAPDAAAHLTKVKALSASVIDPVVLELVRLRIATLLGNDSGLAVGTPESLVGGLVDAKIAALSQWPTSPLFSATDRACLALAEQFVIDVSGVTDQDVSAVLEALGPAGLYGFVQALYIFDMTQRLEMSLEAPSAASVAMAEEAP